jgi:hypothetical protein
MADRRRIAAALEYLGAMRDRAAEFGSGVAGTLANRARDVGGLAYEALTSDPNIGRMNTAEFADAAASRAPTPRLDAAGQGAVELGRAVLTQPVQTGKAIVQGEVDRARQAMTSPRAAGEYAGSMVDPLRLASALRRGPMLELDVYHGTPHRFEPTEANPLGELDASKIGSGEGAQAYGHGIYLAESPDVAKGYKERLSGSNSNVFLFGGKEVSIVGGSPEFKKFAQIAKNEGFSHESAVLAYNTLQEKGGDLAKASSELGWKDAPNPFDDEAATLLRSLDLKPEGGALYTLDLPDEMIDRMLDWDKPLSEQSPYVQKIIGEEIKRIGGGSTLSTGERAYKELMFQARMEGIDNPSNTMRENSQAIAASNRLRELGIPGIKYLDAGSRGDTDVRTRNFVVFPGEEKKVKVLRRE